LLRYMVNGYKSLYKAEDTFFEGIKEVPFATNLTIDSNLNERSSRYWVPRHKRRSMTLEESVEAFRERLLESVRIRLRADVPLAFCLSGGVDSASIVSIAAKCFDYDVATFSIVDSDERYNERDNIQATLDDLKCKHTIIETSHDGFFERLSELIDYHDAPLYTISYYIHSFLSESIAKHGYRVVCSGTGADEMVTGYYDHFNLYLYEMRNSRNYPQYLEDWKQNVGRFVRNPYLKQPELYFNNPRFRGHIYLDNDVFSGYMNESFTESLIG
jgi:asparagine synthase (glutamine-hydrolysing)